MTISLHERIPEPLRAALERRGFAELTAVQEAALDACGEDRDLQISSQTGSGKTVALGMVAAPMLLEAADQQLSGPAMLVIVPTRELAAQVSGELAWLYADIASITLQCVTGGTNQSQERWSLKNHPRVLVGTPGRLLDHIKSGAVSLAEIRHLVLDEADQMLDMGFREDLEAILDTTPAERQTHLVSATFPPAILRLAERYQRNPQHVEGTQLGVANADIHHQAYRVRENDRYAALVNMLIANGDERTLVFVNTRSETSELAERLTTDGFSAQPLSGELVQAQRTRTLAAFKNGAVAVLVATDVASRGLDLPDVSTVIHTAPGMDSEVYTHRSGRTGRAGNKGRSIMLVSPKKERRVRSLFEHAGVDVEWCKVPTIKQVMKIVDKRGRKALSENLENAPDPTEDQLEGARRLLDDQDPIQLIATLLEQNKPKTGPQPRELGVAPSAPQYADRAPRSGAPAYRGAGGQSSGAPSSGGTRFFINWGTAAGATPKHILAHVCRRGDIQGRNVGAITMDARGTTFEVESSVASQFEERAKVRDSRDPHLRIQRAYGNATSSPYGKPAARSGGYEKKPYGKPAARSGGYEKKPYSKSGSFEKKPYGKPGGSFEKKPYVKTGNFEEKPYSKPGSFEKKPYVKSGNFEEKPYSKPGSFEKKLFSKKPYGKPAAAAADSRYGNGGNDGGARSDSYGKPRSFDKKPFGKPGGFGGKKPYGKSKPYGKPGGAGGGSYGKPGGFEKKPYAPTASENNRPGELSGDTYERPSSFKKKPPFGKPSNSFKKPPFGKPGGFTKKPYGKPGYGKSNGPSSKALAGA